MEHERGLAGAVGPEHGDPLARAHDEVDAEQRLAAVGVGEGQAPDLEGRIRSRSHAHQASAATHAGQRAGRHSAAAHSRPRRASLGEHGHRAREAPGQPWPGAPARPARRTG